MVVSHIMWIVCPSVNTFIHLIKVTQCIATLLFVSSSILCGQCSVSCIATCILLSSHVYIFYSYRSLDCWFCIVPPDLRQQMQYARLVKFGLNKIPRVVSININTNTSFNNTVYFFSLNPSHHIVHYWYS